MKRSMPETIPTEPSTSMGSLRLNGQPVALTASLNLSDLLAQHSIAADSVATAVNGQFVPRGQRAATALRAGDEVLTFQAIVGG
jgi:sulfur carrier protein